MVHITHDDVRKVARLSHIAIYDQEIEKMAQQLQSILNYASRIADYVQVVSEVQDDTKERKNIVRSDVVIKTDSELILVQAPEREGNYFVVPVIVDAGQ